MRLFGFNRYKDSRKQESSSTSVHHIRGNRTELQFSVDYDISSPMIRRDTASTYIPFAEDNLYPQHLLNLYHRSPFHAAILEFKQKTIIGDGLEFVSKGNTLDDKIRMEKLKNRFSPMFLKRIVLEWLIHERLYFEVHRRGEDVGNWDLTPAEFVRVAVNRPGQDRGFWWNDSWDRGRGLAEFVPVYDKYNTEDMIQLVEFKESTPGVYAYPLPVYSSAANWIMLDANISYFQKQNMEQSINPSALIMFPRDIANKEEKREFIENLQSSYAGAKNAGKVLVFFANGKENIPEVTITEANKLDKSFESAQENIIKNVAYAHLINPSLMGIATEGKLGMSNELNEAYALYNIVYLENVQNTIEYYLNELLDILGYKDIRVNIKRKETFLPEITLPEGYSPTSGPTINVNKD